METNVARFRDSVIFKEVIFSNRIDDLVINPSFEFLSSRAIQNIPNILSYLFWFPSESRLKSPKL